MVEGPGATRNGRKVQSAVGKTQVPVAESTSVDSGASCPTPPTLPRRLADELASRTLEEAFTVGKELFLIFAASWDAGDESSPPMVPVALRLHFGMSGSLIARKVNSSDLHKKPSCVPPWKRNNDPSLRIYFVDNNQTRNVSSYIVVEAWETTITYPVSATNSRNKLMELNSRDACSTSFNAQDVFTSIRRSGGLIISDALLNQDIFPGVGNIIKIESLHRSKIDPRRAVSSLSDIELRRLIRHTRKFSMDWLNSGRAGTKLVYNQTSCGTCQGMTVKMQKIGGASSAGRINGPRNGHAFMSRVTFWCTVCQPLQHVTRRNDVALDASSDSLSNGNENILTNATAAANRRQSPGCPQHGLRSTKLCRVRKGNENTLRIFFTCKFRGCQFFQWADSQFSNCRCGRKAALRVSKTERSGGRWFLCCATGDKSMAGGGSSGCGHFEWAKDEQIASLRSLLTPLL